MKGLWIPTAAFGLLLAGCNFPESGRPAATDLPPPAPTLQPTEAPSPTPTLAPTATPLPSITATSQPSATQTPSATITPTPTESWTPSPEVALITADVNLNCRYGPDSAYLYAWGLSAGDTAQLDGKNYAGTWLWVKPHDTDWHCWVTASGATANVDLSQVPVVYPNLITNPSVQPPTGVRASRSGSQVILSWNPAPPAVDLGYLIEARVCSNGYLIDVVYNTTRTSFSLSDETTCSGDSYGQVRVFNKLGYSTAVKVAWP